MPGAIVPVDFAFALLKSARVSTAGAIRARYHGTSRRVLFKATSINLSQDARCTASEGESNCDSFHAPEYQRGRTVDKTANPCPLAPDAVRLRPFAALPPAWIGEGQGTLLSPFATPLALACSCYIVLTTKLSTPRAPSGAPYDD